MLRVRACVCMRSCSCMDLVYVRARTRVCEYLCAYHSVCTYRKDDDTTDDDKMIR